MKKGMYSLPIILFASTLIGVLGIACKRNDDTSHREQARELYKKSVSLNKIYVDSLSVAKDSATVILLDKRYEEALSKLNFKYPADTDYDMTEGENDTIAALNIRFATLRDSLLYRFAHPIISATDSVNIEKDSIQ